MYRRETKDDTQPISNCFYRRWTNDKTKPKDKSAWNKYGQLLWESHALKKSFGKFDDPIPKVQTLFK